MVIEDEFQPSAPRDNIFFLPLFFFGGGGGVGKLDEDCKEIS